MEFVLVTTEYRGVFAGYLKDHISNDRRIILTQARCAINWATSKGFLELAQDGPNSKSNIGAVAPVLELYGVTSVATCTQKAQEAWINA
jgi:hypothetical protein